MASLNTVFLLGNLTRDPDLRGLPSGQNVCELRLAVSRRFQNSSGHDVEDTCFVVVVVWGRTAANCKQFLSKGSQVMVEGRLQLDQWEDRNGGGQRQRLRVVAEQIQFMNRRQQNDGAQPNGYAPRSNGNPMGHQVSDYGQPNGVYTQSAPGYNQGGSYGNSPYGDYSRGSQPMDQAPSMPGNDYGQSGPGDDEVPF
ncbi:MAG: single-stranded DNA-binding protein [Lentisphaeria bacterium]|nr:single-stranded DNA-binding protein [Lentisphaeria bacterium]